MNNRKVFVITFDPHKTNAQLFHQAVIGYPKMLEWWHYLGSTYLITATPEATANDLEKYLVEGLPPNTKFFFSQLKSRSTTGGLLPTDAWEWLNTRL